MPLTVFYPQNEDDLDANADLKLDIVAVHGLNGDSHRTWTCKKSKKLWLRDFLPQNLPTARIMTFGYDATAAFQNSVADIEDHARDLLVCLTEKRQNDVANRPLIFVAHSLGGHVVKQALVLASRENRYSSIFNNTSAVVFFGTPHQGSDLATYGRMLARVPSLMAGVPSPGLLESLMKGSSKLQTLTADFMRLLDIRAFDIVSFYETRPLLYIRKLVVTKQSALLTPPGEAPVHELQVPVPADHRKMCQFASQDIKTYRIFVTNVKRILQGGLVEVKNEHFIVSQLENLNFTGRSDIRHLLYESLLKDRHMRKKSQDRFVLHGLGGSGKTQVCLKFAHDHRNHYESIFWVDASTQATANQGFLQVARKCNQIESVESVKGWLANKDNWLLIIDNADDPSLDIAQFFPPCDRGAIIITTRNPDSRQYASQPSNSYHVDQMSAEDGTSLLLKISLKDSNDESSRQLGTKVVQTLGNLALAIVQAGAVIRQNLCSLETFCAVYAEQKKDLLEMGKPPSDYDNSVYTTWEISLKHIQSLSANDCHAVYALELLKTFSFLHFDGISERMFENAKKNTEPSSEGSMYNETSISRMMPSGWDQLIMSKALKILLDFSLITVDDSRQISMHPLVHEWSRDRMSSDEREHAWEAAVSTLAMSIYQGHSDEEVKHRGISLPHIDACLASPEGKRLMFADGLRVVARFEMVEKFADAYGEAQRHLHALELNKKTERLKRLVMPRDNISALNTERKIACCLAELCRYEEAVPLQESILELVREKARGNELDANPLVLKQELANMYNSWGKHEKALGMLEEVVESFERTFGADHGRTWCAKISLACCLCNLGRCGEAIEMKKQILHHDYSLKNIASLAWSYSVSGQKPKARKLYEILLAEMTLRYGEFHPWTLQHRACAMVASRIFERKTGIEARMKDLEIMEANFGELNPATILAMSSLAEGYFDRGWAHKAKHVQMRTVDCSIRLNGSDSPYTLREKNMLRLYKRAVTARKYCYWWIPDVFLKGP